MESIAAVNVTACGMKNPFNVFLDASSHGDAFRLFSDLYLQIKIKARF